MPDLTVSNLTSASTALAGSDEFIINHVIGVTITTCRATLTHLRTSYLNTFFQPLNSTLTTLSTLSLSALGRSVFERTSPSQTAYALVTTDGTLQYRLPSQVPAEIGAATISGTELLLNKTINGLTPAIGTAPATDAPIQETTDRGGDVYKLTLVKVGVGYSLQGLQFRLQGSTTDLILPTTGTVATVGGTVASSQISTDGTFAANSDSLIPTQRATKTYVNAVAGFLRPMTPETSLEAFSTLNLDDTISEIINITGNTLIEAILLSNGRSKILVFAEALTIQHGTGLICPGGRDLRTSAGSWAMVRGLGGGACEVLSHQTALGYRTNVFENILMSSGANIGFGNIFAAYYDIGRSSDVLNGGCFMRMMDGASPRLIRHDLSSGISLNIENVTTTIREVLFQDFGGKVALLTTPPLSASSDGTEGMLAFDTDYGYYCVADNTWKRWEMETWI